MNFISVFMAVFAVVGALDLLIGNRFGMGREFEKGFKIFGEVALSLIGMVVIAPVLGKMLMPVSNWIYETTKIDPSLLPSVLLVNDMGGAALAEMMAKNKELGLFNGLVVSSMMGCTVSALIPISLNMVKQEKQKHVLFGFLCGIITIPIGCLSAGLLRGIVFPTLVYQLLPLVALSLVLAVALIWVPNQCIKVFGIFGKAVKMLSIVGLMLGIIHFLTGIEIIKGLGVFKEGADICVNACVVMSGAFPFLYLLSKIIKKPLESMRKRLGINETSAMGFFSSLATCVTTFEAMENMDEKGIVLNAAFLISSAYVFAGSIAFTLAFCPEYLLYVTVGKLVGGISALFLAAILYKRIYVK